MDGKYKTGSGEMCAVKSCSNSRKSLYKWDNSKCDEHDGILKKDCACIRPFKLHYLPKNPEIRRAWISALNRKDPPKNIVICSNHFIDGKPTPQNPVPQLHLGYDSEVKVGRKAPRKRTTQNDVSDGIKKIKGDDDNDFVMVEIPSDSAIEQEEPSASVQQVVRCDKATEYEDFSTLDHQYSAKPIHLVNCQSKKVQTDVACTSGKSVQCGLDGEESVASKQLKTDTDALFMAGVTLTAFWTIVATLKKFNTFTFTLCLEDQILLVLMRLRQDLELGMLARTFKVSVPYVSKVFNSWITVMADVLGKLIVWLPRETIRATLPKSFNDYKQTTCIIDCAETFIQRPTCLKDRAETYSSYKGHNTAKYLVGISPHGQIMFVSRSYGGRASDKYIVKDCGFLNYLRPGDEIMADRGFTIEEELFIRKVKLNIPAFTRGKKQLSADDVTGTRRIASVRIHIERAIRRLKVFRILAGTVRVHSLKKFDEILIVCSALVNLRPDLVKDKANVNTELSTEDCD